MMNDENFVIDGNSPDVDIHVMNDVIVIDVTNVVYDG